MKATLLEVLAGPGDGAGLEVSDQRAADGEVLEGTLTSTDGRSFRSGKGCLAWRRSSRAPTSRPTHGRRSAPSGARSPTRNVKRWPTSSTAGSSNDSAIGDKDGLDRSLDGARWVIDAGTGPGIQAARLSRVTMAEVVGMDLSESVVRARLSFTGTRPNLHFVQGDILNAPFRPRSFDLVVADQVLHHIPDCKRAFDSMAELVRPGGELATYIYRVKPLLREFADEEVRKITTRMSVDECMEFSEQVTELGRELSAPQCHGHSGAWHPPARPRAGGARRATPHLLDVLQMLLERPARRRREQPRQLRLVSPAVCLSPHRGRASRLVSRCGISRSFTWT